MKLYLRRDKSSEKSRFIVYDHKGDTKYYVKGRRNTATDKMVITDVYGKTLLTLRVAPFQYFYIFSVKGEKRHFVLTLSGLPARAEFRFHGITWYVSDFSPERNLTVSDIDKSVVMTQISKSSSYDYHELTINKNECELYCVATAICADVVNYLTLRNFATV